MNVGRAIRLCRAKRGVSQGVVARQANCSDSYLSMLENNRRDPTLSMLMRIAQALQMPVGLLFFLAADQEDLGPVDERTTGKLMESTLALLVEPADAAARSDEPHS